ncbi:hypothetical protein TNCV_554791 [Trichonephila clavipes]|nr:hypothetical protein TNCV_554791 [Trichonephila clavipes]
MAVQQYIWDVLQPHMLPFMARLRRCIFQENNFQPHTTRTLPEFLQHVAVLAYPIPRSVTNRACLGSFDTAS